MTTDTQEPDGFDTPDTTPAVPDAEANLDLIGYTDEDFTLHPDAALLPDLSNLQVPPPPPENEWGQDEEGLGGQGLGAGIEAFVRPWPQALAIVVGYIKDHKEVTPGYCLRETRGYYNVFSKYVAAKDSLAGAINMGVAHRVQFSADGVKAIPRGAIVYWRKFSGGFVSGYGHIAPSFGGGFCGSTDWPTGHYGRVNIYTLAKAWGYTEIWWAPVVNDVRVWAPPAKPKPTPLVDAFLDADDPDERTKLLEKLKAKGDGDRPEQVKRAAERILSGRADNDRARELKARADKRIATGRQALRGLSADHSAK